MSGFDAESDGITTAAGVLHDAVETMSGTITTLDGAACANLGPGRLGGLVAELLTAARTDLGGVLDAVAEDARQAEAALAGYTDLDERAAENFRGSVS